MQKAVECFTQEEVFGCRKQCSVFHTGRGIWVQKAVECVLHRKRCLGAESTEYLTQEEVFGCRKQWSEFHIGSGVWVQKAVECVSHRKRCLGAESSVVSFR